QVFGPNGEVLPSNDLPLLDEINYPIVLHAILLCDGSIAYVMEDRLTELVGSYIPLDQLTITSPNMLLSARLRGTGPNQLFGLELDYEKNGNIEKATWKTTYHTPKRYEFSYDKLNRLEGAEYMQATIGGGFIDALDVFTARNISYDAVGNILSLDRRGVVGCGGEFESDWIDKLKYTYPDPSLDANGEPTDINRLVSILDEADEAGFEEQGFNRGNAANNAEYQYDGAGRLTYDPYKDITITYNHLDLPATISGNGVSIEITYDATGRKWLQKTGEEERLYVGGMEFIKDDTEFELEAANTGDGRLVVGSARGETESSSSFGGEGENKSRGSIYAEYHHKDHLGNVRVAFADRNGDNFITLLGTASQVEITQQLDYYPFGLQQQGQGLFHAQQEPDNRYRFNGIEHVEELGLDLAFFRSYDPAIGRWLQVDPKSESFVSMSPYTGMGNNPILYNDILGDSIPSSSGGLEFELKFGLGYTIGADFKVGDVGAGVILDAGTVQTESSNQGTERSVTKRFGANITPLIGYEWEQKTNVDNLASDAEGNIPAQEFESTQTTKHEITYGGIMEIEQTEAGTVSITEDIKGTTYPR
ncbi:MAG: RHS repeat-associated core domain-containing protein, partial [Bacteroidota bacterium]